MALPQRRAAAAALALLLLAGLPPAASAAAAAREGRPAPASSARAGGEVLQNDDETAILQLKVELQLNSEHEQPSGSEHKGPPAGSAPEPVGSALADADAAGSAHALALGRELAGALQGLPQQDMDGNGSKNLGLVEDFPGFGNIFGKVLEDAVCKRASAAAQPTLAKCNETLRNVTARVDHLLNGTLQAKRMLAKGMDNGTKPLKVRLQLFEDYVGSALGLGVQQWGAVYRTLAPMTAMASTALEQAGMQTLAKDLNLSALNSSLYEVLQTYTLAKDALTGIGNKSAEEAGLALQQLNVTLMALTSSADALRQGVNASLSQLTSGLSSGLLALLPQSCSPIWTEPLQATSLTVASLVLKVHESVHQLAEAVWEAEGKLGLAIPPTEDPKLAHRGGAAGAPAAPAALLVAGAVAAACARASRAAA